ncbi:CRISPR-associated endonuclease Cas2 [Dechloromonas sp.]|uniref:CRISPR-associated endonuclease Cas2 n=1 Tax=Dechloromonas sp. TaxID=1917218 RepID=UPI002171EEA2|nr:CRISPR-associated endonuclease Cas2 [Dechloromonas sp.]MBU3696532.1 CRISPR-associated endonuclease Cas2 [Dechloromonas sp.]
MTKNWLIGYDISNPRRLGRVHRVMANHATPIEYSIFLYIGSDKGLAECLSEVSAIIDPNFDDVRCYPLPSRGLQERIGRATLPDGIQWSGLPTPLGPHFNIEKA